MLLQIRSVQHLNLAKDHREGSLPGTPIPLHSLVQNYLVLLLLLFTFIEVPGLDLESVGLFVAPGTRGILHFMRM